MIHEIAVTGGAVGERCVELLLGRVEIEKKLEHLVVNLERIGKRAVDFVDHDDGLQSLGEGFAEHETCLRLWAARCIDDEENAVHHFHDALHFGSEVGVARGIDDVDRVAIVKDGGVLRLDGDALFALEIHGVHGAFLRGLVLTVSAAGLEKLVNEGGFAVVNVGNDGEVTDLE